MIRAVLASRRSIGGPLTVGAGAGGPPVLSGLQFWIDGSDISTLFQDTGLATPVTADGQMTRGQKDKSGNGYHVTEGSAGPTYKAAIQNGLSITRWNKTHRLSYTGPSLDQPTTIFIVGKSSNLTTEVGNFIDGNSLAGASGGNGRHIVGATTGNAWRAYGGGTVSGGTRDTAYHVFSAVLNGVSSSLYVDGSLIASGNGGVQPMKMIRVGTTADGTSDQGLIGDIGEILIYSGALSSADRQSVEAYLNSKWAIY